PQQVADAEHHDALGRVSRIKRPPRIRLCRAAGGAPLRGCAEGATRVVHVQSLNVRWPEIMVLTTLERPMMSSRTAAYTCTITKTISPHMPRWCQVCTSCDWPKSGITQPNSRSCHEP